MSKPVMQDSALIGDAEQLESLFKGDHANPHGLLGAHPGHMGGQDGAIVRAFHPDAVGCTLIREGEQQRPMTLLGSGAFAAFLPGIKPPFKYRLRFEFADGTSFERDDPYRFLPTLGELDLHLIGEGNHRRLWEVLGSHVRVIDGVQGTAFAVWAPGARRVSVIGDFNRWDGRVLPMRALGASGVFELFVPGIGVGSLYKYEIKTENGDLRIKADPLGREMEHPPATATRINVSSYQWRDEAWMKERLKQDPARLPITIYELHLGSWMRVPEEGNRWLSYREIAPRLVEHVKRLGFTHLEIMPIAEHAYYPSWGYQVTGYYAPTARYGSPDDFRYFVDYCHQHGIGVIMDWVPAHFPKDDFSLRRFDGTALYEHEDVRRGEHPDWGTLIFNYGRTEVKNFLVANALYWLKEFHIDALRVDAVASMLYLDYSRKEGEWMPNAYGGRENIEAIEFLRFFNEAIRQDVPGAFTVAEESTAWGGVTRPASEGGLGFTFKWNMGWMHDTLGFFSKEPVHRKFHVDQLTFAMLYEHTEQFINSISHDEVTHGKGTVVEKMPGDFWQKLANLRLLLAYQFARPGKQLMFMGTEFAQHDEWNHDRSLDWHIANHPQRLALQEYLIELIRLYKTNPVFWRKDPDADSFEWIDCSDKENTVLSFVRKDGNDHAVVVMNFTPVPREGYRIGVPNPGRYIERLSSDDVRFAGSDFETLAVIEADPIPAHGKAQSLNLKLPPLGALVLMPAK
ncbi:MAG TPA: 1,4-alpha-glucan branching protein GlgB [Polyangiaceae bacterium]|nr:1,4-alpha-glucan branching protein GlgB [Polyangiaceae bacterium]